MLLLTIDPMLLLTVKALHIISFTAWFAGLFYLLRIFVYQIEAKDKPENESQVLIPQYKLMQDRVYKIIATPAMVATWSFGVFMICAYGMEWFKYQHWLHLKLVLLVGLTGFHHYSKSVKKALARDVYKYTSFQMRLINEIPTLFLFSIVILAVLKNLSNFSIVFGVIFALGLLLYLGAKFYKRLRKK